MFDHAYYLLVYYAEQFNNSRIICKTGKKEQEVILDTCNCPVDFCHPVHLLCIYNPCRKERGSNCKRLFDVFQK